jgi:succinylglutamate desuccinylase
MTQLRKEYTMFKTTLIAAAALAAVTAGMTSTANAKVHVDLHASTRRSRR